MLFRQKVVEQVADALSGIALPAKKQRSAVDASVLIYQTKGATGEAPLIEITFTENRQSATS